MNGLLTPCDVERWNDAFAREHDIDQYYAKASPLIRWVERRRLALVRSLLDARPGHRLLEVGCGGGHVLQMFPECHLTGVDVSGEMLARARRNLKDLPVELHKGEISRLKLPAGGYDRIICTEVLEHVVDPDELLAGMLRLLAPGGRIVVTIPNDVLIHRIKSLIRVSRLDILPPLRRIAWGGERYHLHVWSVAEMHRLLERHFNIVEAQFAPMRWLPIRACFALQRRE